MSPHTNASPEGLPITNTIPDSQNYWETMSQETFQERCLNGRYLSNTSVNTIKSHPITRYMDYIIEKKEKQLKVEGEMWTELRIESEWQIAILRSLYPTFKKAEERIKEEARQEARDEIANCLRRLSTII